tara:strand:- start:21880 stop:23364 length:1485 start_codon:yes stop_codon:yes gene_type:complete
MTERVRFAPSPTGPLHIGGLRTALFNYLYAKKNNGVFVLRIEDTDQKRKVEGSEEYIFDSLEWAGISPDESVKNPGKHGPYRQSKRNDIYKKYVKALLEKKGAYYAFDNAEVLTKARELDEEEKGAFKYNYENRGSFENSLSLSQAETEKRIDDGVPYVIRLWVSPNEEIIGEDEIRNTVRINSSELEDKVLVKADGTPTYHLANVIDDHCMEITTVIRGEEWLPSLPIHVLLYEKFGWEKPKFVHLPLILNPSGKGKLSKRDGDKNGYPVFPIRWKDVFEGYKEKGFLPAAHLNYIAQLGCSSRGEDEIMSLKNIIDEFDLANVQKGGARFDYEKAKWVNQQHIKRLKKEELVSIIKRKRKDLEKSFNDNEIHEIAELIQDRIVLLEDIESLCVMFLESPKKYDEMILQRLEKQDLGELVNKLKKLVENEEISKLKDAVFRFCKNENIGMGVVMQTLRIAVVGTLFGPDIIRVINVIGKYSTLERLKQMKNLT